MRCPKCGKKLEDAANQCPVCKTIIASANPTIETNKKTTNNTNSAYTNRFSENAIKNRSTYHYSGIQIKQQTQQQQPQQFQQQQQTQFRYQQPPQQPRQNNTRFCATCGAPMDANVPFCSKCGASIQNSKIKSNTGGVKLSNINYLVYALIGSNLILAFTSLIGYVSKYFDPASAHGSHTEAYSFWYLSSSVWRSRDEYKLYKEYLNRLGYSSSDKSYFWPIFSIIIMYISIAVCAVFVVIALYKAYSTINNNNKSNILILKPLRIASIMAIIQLISMIVLKGNADISDLSLTVWFWLFAILAGFSLIAEIFLIKADSTSSKGTV